MDKITGRIFDIQRFSIGNGPGIRTTVFLKGCPLSCKWCHNPESIRPGVQLMHDAKLCKWCGACERICPYQAICISKNGYTVHRKTCVLCGACEKACNYSALKIVGREMDAEELLEIIRRDRAYYQSSGGGVTFSGGEPTMQPEFLLYMLERIKQEGISTAIDTCGWCKESIFEKVLDWADFILFDLKHMDAEEHRKLTGKGNEVILKNFISAVKKNKQLIVRYPMIPGLNDSYQNIRQMCEFLKQWDISDLDVSVYHNYGQSKYEGLDMPYDDIEEYSDREKKKRLCWLEEQGMIWHEI